MEEVPSSPAGLGECEESAQCRSDACVIVSDVVLVVMPSTVPFSGWEDEKCVLSGMHCYALLCIASASGPFVSMTTLMAEKEGSILREICLGKNTQTVLPIFFPSFIYSLLTSTYFIYFIVCFIYFYFYFIFYLLFVFLPYVFSHYFWRQAEDRGSHWGRSRQDQGVAVWHGDRVGARPTFEFKRFILTSKDLLSHSFTSMYSNFLM